MNGSRAINVATGSSLIRRDVPRNYSRRAISDSVYGWQEIVKDRLEELVRLEPGWDGYAGHPVSFDVAMFAYRMLESICGIDTPSPQIVPGSSGDLQVEWHTPVGDIELWVRAPNNVHAWRESADGNESDEMNLSTNFAAVSDWVREYTEPLIAGAAAA